MTLIFERGEAGRCASSQAPQQRVELKAIPDAMRRRTRAILPEVSELQVVRHYTNLSRKNFAIDTMFYPLGSCTMKYNPRGAHRAAMLPGFLQRHPLAPETHSQGYLACLHDLQETLMEVTGMKGVSLTPMAGAQGEFAGVAMIRAYHEARNDSARTEMLIPAAAHGTNPATAVMCGYKVREIPVLANGDVDLDALKAAVGPQTAGLMMTNPSTCGVFEQQIKEIAEAVHTAGGLLYYDGANLNAILGKVRPGDMGFDVLHMNLHKTFATPHGGGGPGAGPVGVSARLLPYMPTPIAGKNTDGSYRWLTEQDIPGTIGRLSTYMGNAGVLLRAAYYAYALGREGLHRVGEYSTLNANYLMKRLADAGFQLAYPERRASHEFIISFAKEAKELNVSAMDIAKRLLDYGYHAPTTYFPLLIPECFLIEPTETESPDELDGFAEALIKILEEARTTPDMVRNAPHTMPVRRLDDVRAARELDLVWRPQA
ncbi:glycine dehydrogenase (decarboxylating) beta subunit [Paraperlucidibaca baekdonensis]|uniref:Probable glycine dehydrogenase (decarboxylating) subunit 2 n=1 Tax=Paraperlucidibaca baekdonensis TaxID=748120 RepID=A0A3E0H8C7_9GAMM|nr:aminomethyl-transferring glycine dehydrogenase subunit GcvPB [Paraperlucidibaca baekdonensis]REH39986.1 glycine dehydrogenase (decarboxylating) beta subunit [Paraperlucidibaca baekdonensis]